MGFRKKPKGSARLPQWWMEVTPHNVREDHGIFPKLRSTHGGSRIRKGDYDDDLSTKSGSTHKSYRSQGSGRRLADDASVPDALGPSNHGADSVSLPTVSEAPSPAPTPMPAPAPVPGHDVRGPVLGAPVELGAPAPLPTPALGAPAPAPAALGAPVLGTPVALGALAPAPAPLGDPLLGAPAPAALGDPVLEAQAPSALTPAPVEVGETAPASAAFSVEEEMVDELIEEEIVDEIIEEEIYEEEEYVEVGVEDLEERLARKNAELRSLQDSQGSGQA